MNPRLITAIRTVGQLLLHHPTTGHYARSNSGTKIGPFHSDANCFCFCFLGACFAVQNKLHQSGLQFKCAEILQWPDAGGYHHLWDRASTKTRKQWAQKLADFQRDFK